MQKKRTIVLVALLLAVVVGWAIASPMVEEQTLPPIQELSAPEVTIGPELRFIKDPPLERWGTRLALVNDSGYTIERFDLYNPVMAHYSPEVVNLLETPLVSGERRIIDLLSHLLLFNAIAARDGLPFSFTAMDGEGDYYYGVWDPAYDSWNLNITLDQYRSDFLASQYPDGGTTLALLNQSGKDLENFALEAEDAKSGEEGEVNLLSPHIVPPGQRALIPRSQIPALTRYDGSTELSYSAIDSDGGHYRGTFYPAYDGWAIAITPESFVGTGRYTLYVDNQLDDAIWFLYAMTAEEYLHGEWGDDILGMGIIQSGESEAVDFYGSDRWAERLEQGWEGRLYIVAETYDEERYLTYTEFSSDYPTMFVNFYEERRIGAAEQEQKTELVLYNRTGDDLWELYAVTSLDGDGNSVGDDLLGDGIWGYDEYVTLTVDDLGEVERAGVLRLYAVDVEGNVYAKSWAIGGERHMIFRQSDSVE